MSNIIDLKDKFKSAKKDAQKTADLGISADNFIRQTNDKDDKIKPENYQNTETDLEKEDIFPDKISWTGPASMHSPDRRFVIISTALLGFVASAAIFLFNDIIAAILFVFIGIMVAAQTLRKKPSNVYFEISSTGIKISEKSYSFNDIESFWVEYEPDGIQELSVELKRWYMPYIKIPIYGKNPLQIRGLLIRFTSEREHEDTFAEILGRKLGL